MELRGPDGDVYDTFRYRVVRVWEQPVGSVLACGLTVPPVSRVAVADVPAVLLAFSGRLEREATPEQAAAAWNATKILMGPRDSTEQIDAVVERTSAMLYGIRGIEESSVYQKVLRKGRVEGAVEKTQPSKGAGSSSARWARGKLVPGSSQPKSMSFLAASAASIERAQASTIASRVPVLNPDVNILLEIICDVLTP